jgi:hypothetical protein
MRAMGEFEKQKPGCNLGQIEMKPLREGSVVLRHRQKDASFWREPCNDTAGGHSPLVSELLRRIN